MVVFGDVTVHGRWNKSEAAADTTRPRTKNGGQDSIRAAASSDELEDDSSACSACGRPEAGRHMAVCLPCAQV